jgi:hypothetical protein
VGRPVGGSARRPPREIRVTEADVKWLKETWTRRAARADRRRDAAARDRAPAGLLAREAREMGLDQDGDVRAAAGSRRRWTSCSRTRRGSRTTEAELRAFHAAHAAWFTGATRTTFTHVFFTDAHRAEAVAARARLEAGGTPFDLGDPILVDAEQREVTREDVAAQFGAAFAEALATLPVGRWAGPVESGYGLHVVKVASRSEGAAAPFDDVRVRVADRWRDERQRDDKARFFARLLAKYDVVLDATARPWVTLPGTGAGGGP